MRITGYDHGVDALVGADFLHRAAEHPAHLAVERVELLGPVERDRRDSIVLLIVTSDCFIEAAYLSCQS
jgi:hypothetical protein